MLATHFFTLHDSSEVFACSEDGFSNNKRKRRPVGTPDPDAQVVSLSPETLMESDQYICEICNQGFQREQNLQMHRRRHKVPWKLLKRESSDARKRVYVCPEPTCLHHDPCHALGDLVGVKKHFRRKHSNQKQWVCDKCSKGYAVQADLKAHLKTCGTRGHSCDCGRVFSRVDIFMEHQESCKGRTTIHTELQSPAPRNSNSSTTSTPIWNIPNQNKPEIVFSSSRPYHATQLSLSIGSLSINNEENEINHSPILNNCAWKAYFQHRVDIEEHELAASRLREAAHEQLRVAWEERGLAEERRQQAKWVFELAEQEFTKAKKIRQVAEMELNKAQVLEDVARKEMNSNILHINCLACKKKFQRLNTL
ncbi:unnamed protein product [Ilex paraguariensis]|uniref:C2H2-type domain-containing protein n=1 Tax=Ilex paraguariensis TaxID=185542 RepID=A0ABC8SC14_9AQUA